MKTVKTIVEANINTQLRGDLTSPIVLIGAPGVGKTSFIKDLTNERNYSLINISAASLSLEECTGLPDFVTDESMDKYSTVQSCESKATKWSVPEIIYQANHLVETTGRPTVILLDDLHRMPQSTKSALYELLLERQLKQYKLNDQVAIVATSNDSSEAGFDGMDSPILNRLAFLNFDPSHEDWYQAAGRFYHHFIASFLKTNSQYLNEQESVINPFATARSWNALSNQMKTLDEKFVIDNLLLLAKQYVSGNAANELLKHVTYMTKINFSTIVKSKKLVKISELPVLDQILYAYIFTYIETVEDMVYLVDLIETNEDEQSFIGFLMANIYTAYQSLSKGGTITVGQEAFITKLLSTDMQSKLSKKDKKLYDSITLSDADKLLNVASQYLI